MKRILILIFSGIIGTAGVAQAGLVFSCKTDNNKYIEVQKINRNLYEYSFGSAAKKEIAIRNSKADLLGRSDRWQGIGRGRWSTMKFQNGEFMYTVWTDFDSVTHTESSGVVVERRGKEVARVGCTPKTAQANFNDADFSW
ncbi:protein Gly1ORF1 [Neisseria lactamica]|uniref:protein Gly1ORF1 n=1 Tax=Neisseria lactamica TaxID=486 RepID=UPI000E0DC639|nr:protein Gly1ORF1 [Neisseria lactamica]